MSEKAIRVVIVGATGKMGAEAVRALSADPQFEVVAGIVREIPAAESLVPLRADLAQTLDAQAVDVVLDLSRATNTEATMRAALGRRIPVVTGVTGIPQPLMEEIAALAESQSTPVMVVPNFAIGAVLMMRFAEMAARWIPDVEIIELHHEKKVDAPSGTAMLTAQRVAKARTAPATAPATQIFKAEGARGGDVDGVPVHSVRLPGLLAHQEVMFGAPGEVLTLRHDAADRSVYMPGVKLCVSRIRSLEGLTLGMDRLLDA